MPVSYQVYGYNLETDNRFLACPGRNFAIAELCMLAARMVQTFDFSQPCLTTRLQFEQGDWDVGKRIHLAAGKDDGLVQIIDLDGTIRTIVHPGNGSDHGKSIQRFTSIEHTYPVSNH